MRKPNYAEAALMTPVTLGELHYVMQHGPRNKSPGTDGICYEFYRTYWESIKDLLAIINEMYQEHDIHEQQTQGIICLPKNCEAKTADEYRPVTLLNTDLKSLTYVLINRLTPLLQMYYRRVNTAV
jgi:hypothetical protein